MTSLDTSDDRAGPAGARRPARRAGAWALGIAAGVTALIALAHAPIARPLLALVGARGGCPVLAGSAAELDAARVRGVAPLRAGGAAASRPALDFVLGVSTQADVRAWSDARGARCAPELAGTALRCSDLRDDGARPPIADAYFRFDARGTLVAIDAMRAGTSPTRAADAVAAVRDRMTRAVGDPAGEDGAATADYLAAGPLRRASVTYRFRDYAADVSATNLGAPGADRVVVREQYRSLE